MAEAPGIPMLGSQISLVSKSDVRYTGRLFNIDMHESTIALQSVQSFGTEGRRKDGVQMPGSDQIYDYVVFRGSDISELTVLTNGPGAPEQPQQPPAPQAHQAQAQPPAVSSAPPAPQEARGWQQQGPPPQQQAHQPGGQQGWAGPSTGGGAGAPQPGTKLHDLEPPPGLVGGQQPPPGGGARAGPVPAPTVAVTPTAPGWQPRTAAGPAQQQQAPARQAQAPGGHPPGMYATSANGRVITAPRQANGTGAAGGSPAAQAAAAAAKATAGPVQAKLSFAQAAGGGGGGGGGGRGSGFRRRGSGRRGGHRGGGRGGGRDAERKPPLEVPKEDFNFEAAFAKFNKDKVVKEAEEKGDEQPGKEKFEDDFFDTMSSDATAGSRRAPFKEQRKQDAETFGTLPNAHRYFGGQRRGGGGRGRGRGGPGRGGNRGRGRGRGSQADGPQAGGPQPVEAH